MNEEIERDNDLKEYCLDRFLDMCVKADVDVSNFEPHKGPDGKIPATTPRDCPIKESKRKGL